MSEIAYHVTDRVAVVTLQAPERRNALSVQMARDLADAVQTAAADE